MRLPLCYPIESRDGTLNADSKMKNMVAENIEGELVAVKRPGITVTTELPPGLAQGLFSLNGMVYGIVNDALINPEIPQQYMAGGTYLAGSSAICEQIKWYADIDILPEDDIPPSDTYTYPVSGGEGVPVGTKVKTPAYWSRDYPIYDWTATYIPTGVSKSGFGSAIAATQYLIEKYGDLTRYVYVATSAYGFVYSFLGNPWVGSTLNGYLFRITSSIRQDNRSKSYPL